ncbi:glycoside hydrolase family 3 N-terminal domain-containing protein, partial [Glutamicibacter protophormiae]|uniref:glycoside hydrolase family 3 N-terminal domain-containing protein n=1 Tax=Glutamicibacter protophormiae TaxID=37930 RepID=UPI003BB187FD
SSPQQPSSPSEPSRETPVPTTPGAQPSMPGDGSSVRDEAEALADGMSVKEQAASLLMAGVPASGASAAQIAALQEQGISNVFLRGRSQLSVSQTAAQVRKITGALERNVPGKLPVWVATDQEGGFVRVLQGPGFTELPTAVKQGAWSQATLKSRMSAVGAELAEAGINVNLAPVADVVPSSIGTANDPIGYFGREYANNSADAAQDVLTVNQALAAEGVQPVVKHFPGLGQVTANTDTSRSVADTSTGSESEELAPFKEAISQDLSWVMVSNARYTQIDQKNDAPFSSKVITGLLREKLGYEGLVISDDLCEAKQVSNVAVGQRAVRFIAAGGTVPLCVNTADAVTMAAALAREAGKDKQFAAQVREAAVKVLEEKLDGE